MRSGPNSPRRPVITSKRRRCTAMRPTVGERSPTCPSVLMPSSARAAACAPSETRARRCRSPKTGDLFASMGYKPALAETEKLLAETVAKTA